MENINSTLKYYVKVFYVGIFFNIVYSFLFCNSALAEGSVDFINYPGYRLFFNAQQQQQLKVYAQAGEYINFGTSHIDIDGGFISIYRPDGTLHSVYDNTGASAGLAIINNNIEELNGPTGGGTLLGNGYIPGVINVQAGEEGIWTFLLEYPSYNNFAFANLLNADPWTRLADQPIGRRVVLSWDITVSKNAAGNNGGNLLTGRVFSNEYISIINNNGVTTSPIFYILTKDGIQYEVSFNETDPWGFPLHASTKGITDYQRNPTYQSQSFSNYIRSADPDTWTAGNLYLYHPQAEDYNTIINNKVFFNQPDTLMPFNALTVDIHRNNVHDTWLYRPPPVAGSILKNIRFVGADSQGEPCLSDVIQSNGVAYLVFESFLSGFVEVTIDIDHDGIFNGNNDLTINGEVTGNFPQSDSLFFEAKDNLGNPIPLATYTSAPYQLTFRGGEVHIMMADVENNLGGVNFTRLNGPASQAYDIFYYDHSPAPLFGPVSGGGTADNPNPTNIPHTYNAGWGNIKMLDYFTYVETFEAGTQPIEYSITPGECEPVGIDTDGDGIFDAVDIDDDNDGISDLEEYCVSIGGNFSCLPGSVDPSHDEDGDGIPNYQDVDDVLVGNSCSDSNTDGICDIIPNIYDLDGDNIPNHIDLDSDNDGILDLVEAGHNQPDIDVNGRIDGLPEVFGDNGLYNPIASDPDDTLAIMTYTVTFSDNDVYPDHQDLDSDNDGVNDIRELNIDSLLTDINNDGFIDIGPTASALVDANGIALLISNNLSAYQPINFDNQDNYDFQDLDSDNDGISDALESGNIDPDGDGRIGIGTPITNNLGQPIANADGSLLTIISIPVDTDDDGLPDMHDDDSDNDGIHDFYECETGAPCPDTDDDGDLDFRDLNSDDDPYSDTEECPDGDPCPDTDNDNIDDFRDLVCDLVLNTPITSNSGPVCEGEDISFQVTNLDPQWQSVGDTIYYIWENGNNTTLSTDTSANFTINSNDPTFITPFRVQVQVMDCYSDWSTPITPTINVLTTLTTSSNTPVCPNDSITLTASNISGVSYEWTIQGSSTIISTLQNPTIAPISNTTTYVCNITNADCINATTSSTTVNMANGISINPTASYQQTPACNIAQVDLFTNPTFTNINNTNADYIWTGPNGFSSILENPTLDPADLFQNGTYYIEATSSDGCTTLDSITVNIQLGLTAPTISVVGDNCPSNDLQLTIPAYNSGTIVSYAWTTPNNSSPSITGLNTNELTILSSTQSVHGGNYHVQVLVDGCSVSSDTFLLEVDEPPIFNLLDNSPVCSNSNVIITLQNPEVGMTYEWQNGNGTIIATDTFVSLNTALPTAIAPYQVRQINGACISDWSDSVTPTIVTATPLVASITGGDVCAGDNVQLLATSASGATYEWRIAGQSIIISTQQNPVIPTLTQTTTFEVSVNNATCLINTSAQIEVVVNESPSIVPTSTLSQNTNCSIATLSLFANASINNGSIDGYVWTGPNDFSSTLENPTIDNVDQNDSGLYNLVVTTSDGCSASENINISISNSNFPLPTITSFGTTCSGEPMILSTATYSGNNVQYNWSTPNNTTTGITGFGTPQLIISNSDINIHQGNYTVEVITDDCSATSDIFILDLIQSVNVEITNTAIICLGDTLTINSTTIPGAAYEWRIEGQNNIISTQQNPDFTNVTQNTNYELTIVGGECLDNSVLTTSVEVNTPPQINATFNLNVNSNCTPISIELFTGTSNPNFTYFWTGPDGFSSSLENPTINNPSNSQFGNYALTVSDGEACSESTMIEVVNNVTPPVTPILDFQASFCEEEDIIITIENIDNNVTYEWINANNTIVGGNTTLNIPANNALAIPPFQVRAIGNTCNSEYSNPTNFIVNNNIILEATTTAAICAGENTQLFATNISGATYQWNIAGQSNIISTQINPIITSLTQTTTFEVLVNNANCLANTTAQVEVIVHQLPSALPSSMLSQNIDCSVTALNLFANASINNGVITNYNWSGPNGFTSNEENPIISPATENNSGLYSITFTSAEGCTATEQLNINIETNNIPKPSISSIGDACAGENFTIFTSIYNGDVTYDWSTPNNTLENITGASTPFLNISSLDENIHQGIYAVEVIVDGCVLQSDSFFLDISPAIPIELSYNQTICEGETVTFNTPSISGANYEWRIADDPTIISTSQNPSFENINESTLFELTVLGGVCIENPVSTALVEVNPTIESDPIFNLIVDEACTPTLLELNAGVNNNTYSYAWSGPNGFTSDQFNPIITNPNSDQFGNYELIVSDDEACTEMHSILIENNTIQPETPELTYNNIVCQGEEINITIENFVLNHVYEWINGNGQVISNQNQLIISSNDPFFFPPFQVRAIGIDCKSDWSISTAISILENQDLVASYSGAACDGTSIQLMATTIEGATYQWRIAGESTILSTQQNPVLSFIEASTIYECSINGANCANNTSAQVEVIINQSPEINPTIELTENPDCSINSLQLLANATNSNNTYLWNGPNGFSSIEENPIITPVDENNNGTYTLLVGSPEGCTSSESLVVFMEMGNVSTPTITPLGEACSGNTYNLITALYTGNNVQYLWSTPGNTSNNIEGIDAPMLIINNLDPLIHQGIYTVQVTVDGCLFESESFQLDIETTTTIKIENDLDICFGESVQLSATSVEEAIYEWRIAGFSTIISTEQNPIFNNLDQNTVFELTVISDNCISNPVSTTSINIHTIPDANPTFNIIAEDDCSISTIELFAGLNANSDLNFNWSGPNNFSSILQNPFIDNPLENQFGAYTLTISDNIACSQTISINVENTFERPETPIINYPSFICEGDDVEIIITNSLLDLNYEWINGNGQSLNNVNSLIITSSDPFFFPPFSVRAIGTDCNSDWSAAANIDVYTLTAALETSYSGAACIGESVQLFATTFEGADYEWRIAGSSDIISSDQNPVFSFLTENTTFECTVINANCVLNPISLLEVEVIPLPNIQPSVNFNQNLDCTISGINLQANAIGNNLSYQWTGPNGFSSTLENPSIIPANESNNGTYTLVATSTQGCESSEDFSIIIENNNITLPTITTIGDPCNGEQLILFSPVYNGNDVQYNWSTPSNTTTNIIGQNTNVLVITTMDQSIHEGDYKLQVIVDGCILDSELFFLSIEENIEINITHDFNICSGEDLQLNATTVEGAGYEWRIAGQPSIISTEQNPIIENVTGSTTFELLVTGNNCITNPIAYAPVIVNETPQVNVAYTLNVDETCNPVSINLVVENNNNNNLVNFSWSGPNGFNSTLSNPIINNVDQNNFGWYTITVTDHEVCAETASILVENNTVQPLLPIISTNETTCQGDDLLLTIDQIMENVSYEWINTNNQIIGYGDSLLLVGNDPSFFPPFRVRAIGADCASEWSTPTNLEIIESILVEIVADSILCNGADLNLQATSFEEAQYEWRIQGTTQIISTEQNPTIQNLSENTVFELTVISDACVQNEVALASVTISNIPNAAPSFQLDIDDTCHPSKIDLASGILNNNDLNYLWTGPNGFVSEQKNPSIQNPSNIQFGEYILIVSNDNSCSDTASIFVENNIISPSIPELNYESTVCQQGNIEIIIENVLSEFSYEWINGNGEVIENINTLNISTNDPFFFPPFSARAVGEDCTSDWSIAANIEITTTPEPFTLTAEEEEICLGQSLQLFASTYSNATYEWRVAGQSIPFSNEQNPIINPLNQTTTFICFVNDVACLNQPFSTITIDIFEQPSTSPTITLHTNPDCSVANMTLSANGEISNGTISSYQWIGPNGFISTEENPVLNEPTSSNNGAYSLIISSEQGCTSMANIIVEIENNTLTTPNIYSIGNVCDNNSIALQGTQYTGNGIQYIWTTPNNITTGITGWNTAKLEINNLDPTIHSGAYLLEVTTSQCTAISDTFFLDINSGIIPTIVSNSPVCDISDIILSIQNPAPGTFYEWINGFGQVVAIADQLQLGLNTTLNFVGPYQARQITESCNSGWSEPAFIDLISDPEVLTLSANQSICSGQAVQLSATSYSNASYEWRIEGEITPFSTVQNPTIESLSQNTVFICTVINAACLEETSASINVSTFDLPSSNPTVAFEMNNDCSLANMVLSANPTISSGSISSYEWSGPNGFSSTTENPLLLEPTITNNGTYSLTITSNQGCTSMASVFVEIEDNTLTKPTISAIGNICESDQVLLQATEITGNDIQYNWTTPNGISLNITGWNTATLLINDLNIDFHQGAYLLEISSENCFVSSDTFFLNINTVDVPILSHNSPVCNPEDLVLNVQNEQTGVSYEWFNGFGQFVGTGAQIQPGLNNMNIEAPYLVRANNDACTADWSLSISPVVSPTIELIATNNGPICLGEPTMLSANYIEGGFYQWRKTGMLEIISTEQNPVINNITEATTFEVTVFGSDCLINTIATTNVTVLPNLIIDPSYTLAVDENCALQSILLSTGIPDNDTLLFSWTGPNGFISTEQHPIILNTGNNYNGTYTVDVLNSTICATTATLTIDNPTIQLSTPTIHLNDTICYGEDIILSVNQPTTNIVYEWINGNGQVIGYGEELALPSSDPSFIVPFSVRAIGTNCNSDWSTPAITEVLAAATPLVLTGDNNICPGESIQLAATIYNDAFYEWRIVGQNTPFSTEQNPILPALYQTIVIECTVSDVNCLASTTKQITVNVNPMAEIQPSNIFSANENCSSFNMILMANPNTTGGTFEWFGPNAYSSTAENPIFNNIDETNEGTYTVTFTNTEGCTTSQNIDVVIDENLLIPIPTISTDGYTCAGQTIVLNSPIFSGNNVQYNWTTPNNTTLDITGWNTNELTISNADINIHSGNYSLNIIVDDCTSSSEVFTLDISNTSTPSILDNSPVCEESNLELRIQNPFINTDYEWENGLGQFMGTGEIIYPGAASPSMAYPPYIVRAIQGTCTSDWSPEHSPFFEQGIVIEIENNGPICEGSNVVLDATTIEGANYEWRIQGTSTVISTEQNPTFSNLIESTIFELTIVGANCIINNQISTSVIVEGIDSLNADYNLLMNENCQLTAVVLQANLENTADYNYLWTGPNNYISTEQNPVLPNPIENQFGLYNVLITNSNGCESTSNILVENNTTVIDVPEINFNPSICNGEDIVLTLNNDLAGITYEWINSNEEIIGYGYDMTISSTDPLSSPPFTVRAISGDCASAWSTPAEITVLNDPDIIISNSGVSCEDEPIYLSVNYIEGAQYEWRVLGEENIFSTQQSPVIDSLTETTTFEVTILNVPCLEENTSSLTIVLEEIPFISSVSGGGSFCQGEEIVLSGFSNSNENNIVTYNWTGPNGFDFTSTAPAVGPFKVSIPNNLNSVGAYNLVLKNETGCLSNVESVIIDISPSPTTPIISLDNAIVCQGESIQLDASVYNGTAVSYEWFIQTGTTSTSLGITNNPTLIIDNASIDNQGFYTVQVIVDGCASLLSAAVVVNVFGEDILPITSNTTNESDPACENEDVILAVQYIPGATYEWFGPNGFNSNQFNPTLSNVQVSDQGAYYVVISQANCGSIVSTSTDVFINPTLAAAIIENNGPACEGSDINLTASESIIVPPGSTAQYHWYQANTGILIATTDSPNLTLTSITENQAGDYYLIIDVDNCSSPISNATTVLITSDMEAAIAGEDISLCETFEYDLSAQTPINGQGIWTSTNAAQVTNPNNTQTNATNLQLGDNLFIWTLGQGICTNQDTMIISVSNIPEEEAFIENNLLYHCEGTTILLEATAPIISTGHWSTNNEGIEILDANNPIISIENLSEGEHEFTWTLSNGNCVDFSSYTATVIIEASPAILADSFVIIMDQVLENGNILENDDVDISDIFELSIIDTPSNGEIISFEDGLLNYQPNAGFTGIDTITYQVCLDNCPDHCIPGNIEIKVLASDEEECFIPNIVTPDGDQKNDYFTIPCLVNYPNNDLKVFNRWGDKVFEKRGYLNDWNGTYKQKPLPSGTYFYILQFDVNEERTKAGYMTIIN